MCTRFTHVYKCGHYTVSTVACANSRTAKCTVYKQKEVDHEYECDSCEDAAEAASAAKA